ncbi:MAG: extracellular solute-binding protein [Propionibacteriaceae bacterium]|jgi:iron(III) transport system substrate-binding protein|nr:extracellular solute-binding protein [Propionibacteriaceae bacterium]
MKLRHIAVLPALALAVSGLAACSGNSAGTATTSGGTSTTTASATSTGTTPAKIGGKLVVYTPNEQNMLDALIPVFKDETGIDVSLVTATTGELYTRIQNEASNPQGDVLFGGGVAQAMANSGLWAPYTAANDSAMTAIGKNVGGYSTPYQADGSNLLVNTDKVGSLTIAGYADLLSPDLKGQIAFGDPANSSSAFAQLTNMLAAMGGESTVNANYTSDKAWNFIKQILQQTGGKAIGSSSQVAQDLAQGEYIVALTYEAQSLNQVAAQMPVKLVYPKEGAVFLPSGVEIIKGAKNLDQAKAFCDWIPTAAAQQLIADKTSGRPLRDGIQKQGVPLLSDIKTITEDSAYVSAHRDEIIAKYQEILASVS